MSKRQKRILIVDDSETFLMYFTILLRRMGFDIIPADNGITALKLLRVLMPDVVVLDIEMPQMDGITTLRHIKGDEHTSNVPVIMVTISSDKKRYEECEKLGCSGYLTKPIKIPELNNTLNDCITFEGGRKRQLLRTSFEKQVLVMHSGETNAHYAVSLSEGGIYIRKRNPFRIGTEVNVTVPLTDEENLTLKGHVIYVRDLAESVFKITPGMAVEFKDVSKQDAEILRSYITDRLTKNLIEQQAEQFIKCEHC